MNLIYIFGAISTFVVVFGTEGRGQRSRIVSIFGGLLWLLLVIYAFYSLSWQKGTIFLIGTFILGAILQSILRPLLNPNRH